MKKSVLLILSLILVAIVSGCVNNQAHTGNTASASAKSNAASVSAYNPTNIESFTGVKEGEKIRFWFALENEDGINTVGNGHASFAIKDSSNKTVYSNEFDFSANNFADYEFKLTGKGIGKVYEWRINSADIKKGTSNTGIAYLTLTTTNGKTLKNEYPFIEIPAYTAEEIATQYENEYIKTSKLINMTDTKGYFEVTLSRLGFFKHLQYTTWGDEIEEFRVDIKVKNVVTVENSFNTYDAKIIVGSSQYDYSYNSNFDSGNIYPGVIREGYIIFKDVPKNISGEARIIVGSHYDSGFDKFISEFTVTL